MPPSVVLLALVAVGVPSAARAALGRPRLQLAATLASAIAVVMAQVTGDLARLPIGVLGDTQLALAILGSVLACAVVAMAEGPRRRR